MNDNNHGNHENNGEKEEIKFDNMDFDNPYSKYFYKGDAKSNQREGQSDNPYSNGYKTDGTSGDQYSDRNFRSFSDDFKVNEDNAYAPLIDEEKEKRNFSRLGLGFALFSLISLSISTIIQFIVLLLNPEIYSSTLFLNLLSPVSLYLFALPVLLIMLSKCEAKAPEKKKIGVGKFFLFLIVAFGFMYIGAMVGNTVMSVLSNLVGYDYTNSLNSIVDDENIWITAVFTVIVAPIGEEFVFRKLIIDRTHKYGAFISIGLSGLMFGLMHGNFYQFFYCFALGLLLGYIYYTTGKLYLTVFIHAAVNFVGSVVTSLISPIAEELASIDPSNTEALLIFMRENILGVIGIAIFDMFVYGAMACAVIFPIVFRRKLLLRGSELSIPRERIASVVIFNGGILAMLIIYVLEFGISLLPI